MVHTHTDADISIATPHCCVTDMHAAFKDLPSGVASVEAYIFSPVTIHVFAIQLCTLTDVSFILLCFIEKKKYHMDFALWIRCTAS